MKYLFLLMNFLFFFGLRAQFGFEFSESICVKKGNDTLQMAFSGGLNYPQFSDIDFDFDGDMDLFVFDRSNNQIRVFIHEENNNRHYYRLEYNARDHFPSDLRYRATMVDYNADGKKDLFTYGIGGVKVYKNVGNALSGLKWTLSSPLLYTDYRGLSLNLYVSAADIPAFVDVEGDGDIDVLTFHINGQHLQYHQNQSMELFGIPDSLIYVLKNDCWGGFREDLNNSTIFLNDNASECNSGNVPNPKMAANDIANKKVSGSPKHAGSAVLALDYDHSGVLDLILGDVAFPNLNLLLNGGKAPNTDSKIISQDNAFPKNSLPVNLQIFPAAFWVDVDFDLKKDLIVCPNARITPENESSVLFYKNVGTNQLPTFVYQSANFLQSEMIEHGTASQPVLVDLDNDGLKDLLVANFYRYIPTLNKESCLAYYRNTGTSTTPVYSFVDFNYLDLNTAGLGLKLSPAFGDTDNDGDADLYLGRDDGTLSYFENKGTSSVANFAAPINQLSNSEGMTISVGQAANPQIFDLDKDGLLDLLIGRKTGEIAYYRNIGSKSNPQFKRINDTLGNISVSADSGDGYSAPHFFRKNDTTYLFLGASDGKLHYYQDIDEHLEISDTFKLVSDNYLSIDAGAYSSFWVDDIDSDGQLNLFVGQDLGGLFHFEANPLSNASLNEETPVLQWQVYPNPSRNTFHIEWDQILEPKAIFLKNTAGQTLFQQYDPENSKHTFATEILESGIYFIQMETKNGLLTRKVVKQ